MAHEPGHEEESTPFFETPTGKVVGGLGAGLGYFLGSREDAPGEGVRLGYQGEIPDYSLVREQVLDTYDPNMRPGARGKRYFSDFRYMPMGDENALAGIAGVRQDLFDQANVGPDSLRAQNYARQNISDNLPDLGDRGPTGINTVVGAPFDYSQRGIANNRKSKTYTMEDVDDATKTQYFSDGTIYVPDYGFVNIYDAASIAGLTTGYLAPGYTDALAAGVPAGDPGEGGEGEEGEGEEGEGEEGEEGEGTHSYGIGHGGVPLTAADVDYLDSQGVRIQTDEAGNRSVTEADFTAWATSTNSHGKGINREAWDEGADTDNSGLLSAAELSAWRPANARYGVGHSGIAFNANDIEYLRGQGVPVQADGSITPEDFKAWADTRGGVRPPPAGGTTPDAPPEDELIYSNPPSVVSNQGGLISLMGGGYLSGSTDGMADDIYTTIDNTQPAALSDGEFVIAADVVSHLGNGNSDAGAEQLYAMMDKIRMDRTGNKNQGKQINPNQYMPRGVA